MKIMERNKVPLYYLLYDRKEAVQDEYGNLSGDYKIFYKPAAKLRASVSTGAGSAQVEQFGNFVSYDKVIITDDLKCPIDENTVLFLDNKPEYREDGTPLYDYIVKRVAKSRNFISYAVQKVSVS